MEAKKILANIFIAIIKSFHTKWVALPRNKEQLVTQPPHVPIWPSSKPTGRSMICFSGPDTNATPTRIPARWPTKEALGKRTEMSTSSAHTASRLGMGIPIMKEVPEGVRWVVRTFRAKMTPENPTAHVVTYDHVSNISAMAQLRTR